MKLIEIEHTRPGGMNSTFWTYQNLTDRQRIICNKLVKGAGPLGWSLTILTKNAHIKLDEIQPLVNRDVVLCRPLREWAEWFLAHEGYKERFECIKAGNWIIPQAREFGRIFTEANQVMLNKDTDKGQELHYQVRPDLYLYIELF